MISNSANYSKYCKICRDPQGAVPDGMFVDITISFEKASGGERADIPEVVNMQSVNMVAVYNDSETKSYIMTKNGADFTYRLQVSKGLYFYYFELEYRDGSREYYYKNGRLPYPDADMPKWQITVYDRNFKTPESFKGGIMYHIFVDRFARSDSWKPEARFGLRMRESVDETPSYQPGEQGYDVYGGNLMGIIEKLGYLKELNVDIIYLSPIFEANTNHKYTTADYTKIDGMFGGDEIFDLLIKEAADRGIKIILDVAFNHTGDDSVYFNKYGRYESLGAYQSKDSPYHDWFTFNDWDNNKDDYECWWGLTNVPSVKKDHPIFRAFICGINGVAEKWIKRGLSGYRIDVADELSDRMLKGINKAAKETKSDSIIIGEVWEDASNKIAYGQRRQYLLGGQLDSVMNYPFKDAVIKYLKTKNSRVMSGVMEMIISNYPKQSTDCLMNIIGTHDTLRILTELGSDEFTDNKDIMAHSRLSEPEKATGMFRLKAAVLMQMTLPGIPCIYYGDEAGMEGYGDPFNRRFFPWDKIDAEIHGFYKKICGIRNKNKNIFADGEYALVNEDEGLFCYKRTKNGNEIYVCVNLSNDAYEPSAAGSFSSLLTGGRVISLPSGTFDIFAEKK